VRDCNVAGEGPKRKLKEHCTYNKQLRANDDLHIVECR